MDTSGFRRYLGVIFYVHAHVLTFFVLFECIRERLGPHLLLTITLIAPLIFAILSRFQESFAP